MRDGIATRWIEGPTATDDEWDKIESVLAARGWMSLNRATSRVRVAEDTEGNLKGFFVLQLTPQAGPLWVAPSERSTGLADELADDMLEFLVDAHARGWLVVADSPHVPPLCEARGMRRVESPVYVAGGA